jgi:L-cysteate sulfo-lyase
MQHRNHDRIALACLPTPLSEIPNVSRLLAGPSLLIKRDDMTGLSFGGNKSRKLEFIMADAMREKADVVITASGLQSNWAQATAAAASKLGMRSILILRKAQFKESPAVYDGNLLLDSLIGAEIRVVEGSIRDAFEADRIMQQAAEIEKMKGGNPYVAAIGGDTPIGTLGYVNAMGEIRDQLRQMKRTVDHIVFASASGGTQAGLIVGAKQFDMNVAIHGINVGAIDTNSLKKRINDLSNETAELLGLDEATGLDEILITDHYPGFADYGHLTKEAANAIRLLARAEGIFLDPVYTSKAFAGLKHLIHEGFFSKEDNVLFLHTGGVAAIFPYKRELVQYEQTE